MRILLLDYYSNVTAEQMNLLENSSTKLDFKLLEEKTCSKQICRKRYVRYTGGPLNNYTLFQDSDFKKKFPKS